MEFDEFSVDPTPEQLARAQRANQALLDYVPTPDLSYVAGDNSPRRAGGIELATQKVYERHFDQVVRYPNDDGSLIIEELYPAALGEHHWLERGVQQRAGSMAVLQFIRFNSWTIGMPMTNSSIVSSREGRLTQHDMSVGESSQHTVSLKTRAILLKNLIGIA
jgi:hypothetical protein